MLFTSNLERLKQPPINYKNKTKQKLKNEISESVSNLKFKCNLVAGGIEAMLVSG